tara:strand:+ start:2020 stop:2271 length:252 start_codon:yes stop_codon:yes gene_type:complete
MNENEEFNVYKEENAEELTDSDEINPEEEGFMQGYNEDHNPSECANCGKILIKGFIEEKIKDETYRFCSEECASKFERKEEHL